MFIIFMMIYLFLGAFTFFVGWEKFKEAYGDTEFCKGAEKALPLVFVLYVFTWLPLVVFNICLKYMNRGE